ncbi:MAG: hypothetical protein LBH75_08010 [Treponema sp.]|jgi:hypothetical protein|nr:hypothetical protein [Treponema sp.]
MKKLVITAILMATVLSVVFAQAVSEAPDGQSAQARGNKLTEFKRPEKVIVSGTLAFVKGRIAVQGTDAVYFTGGLDKLVGFVDGFKEGAPVQLEGYVFTPPNSTSSGGAKLIRTLKVAFNGKSYELRADVQDGGHRKWGKFNSWNHHRNKAFRPGRSGFYPHHDNWNKRRRPQKDD